MRAQPLLALQRQRPGTFVLLIAATCLLMLLAAALALALRAAAHNVADDAAERVIVQVVDADPRRRDTTANETMARLDHISGIASAHRLGDGEAAALIAPYIGAVNARDLPLPVLIEVRTRDPQAVSRALGSLPDVEVTRAAGELRPLGRLIAALRGVALGVALVAAAATGLVAMLSARAALAREATTLEILHALGATDRQLSRLVTGKIARDAGIGATIGLGAAILVILIISSRIAAMGVGMNPGFGWEGWAILALLSLALVGLAAAAAQAALLMTLRRAP